MLKDCHLLIGYVLLVLGLSHAAYLPGYEYIEGVGWLRLHIVPATWADAQLRCHLEDATLTAPTTSAITAVMKTTMRTHRLVESSVFTDIYASNPKGDFTSINGLPISDITLQWAVGEPNNLGNEEDCVVMTVTGELADVSCSSVHAFFCLKRNTTSNCDQCDNTNNANERNNVLEENQCNTAHNENVCNCTIEANQCNTTQEAKQCDTTEHGYTLDPRTGSCYKFHRTGLTWYYAALLCFSERAHLVIINSEEESKVVKELFNQYLPTSIIDTIYHKFAHIGILDWKESGQWFTVLGETLETVGYAKWASGHWPSYYNHDEHCGSVTRSGEMNATSCSSISLAYICEISPKL